ncbi:hypothetical protein ACHAXS_003166 [Conticribra weissflogii]
MAVLALRIYVMWPKMVLAEWRVKEETNGSLVKMMAMMSNSNNSMETHNQMDGKDDWLTLLQTSPM